MSEAVVRRVSVVRREPPDLAELCSRPLIMIEAVVRRVSVVRREPPDPPSAPYLFGGSPSPHCKTL